MHTVDICIVGAGVIGLAIARDLARSSPGVEADIVLLERETHFGQHSSSRNSEVIHAGIYYPENSLKARLCVRGRHLLYDYARDCDIPLRRTGKLIIAQSGGDEQALSDLQRRALANGVDDLEFLDKTQLQRLEPAASGAAALLSPSTGIIDSHSLMQTLLHDAQSQGVVFARQTRVERVSELASGFEVHSYGADEVDEAFRFGCRILINCAGLGAQDLATRIEGVRPDSIPPLYLCKGDYFGYSAASPFQHLVYPLPEQNTTGLGVHGTLDMGGQLRFGPDSQYVEEIDYGVDASKAEYFAAAIKHYFPDIDASRLQPSYAGIRPKLSAPGQAAADFVIQSQAGANGRLIQLFGIESPGLTASLAIAEYVRGLLEAH